METQLRFRLLVLKLAMLRRNYRHLVASMPAIVQGSW